MPRRTVEQIVAAAHGALVEGERVVEFGTCWATQRKPRLPLLFHARRQVLMVLTDRRLLLFARRRSGALHATDLVIGKRYEAFTLEQIRRGRPLYQVRVRGTNGALMIFEFRPGVRHLAGALVARLTPPRDAPEPVSAPSSAPAPAPAPTEAPTDPQPVASPTGPAPSPPGGDAPANPDEQMFWGPPTRGS